MPPSGETRMIAVPAAENRMPLLPQEMPNGAEPTWQIVVAVPPEMAMRLSARLCPENQRLAVWRKYRIDRRSRSGYRGRLEV